MNCSARFCSLQTLKTSSKMLFWLHVWWYLQHLNNLFLHVVYACWLPIKVILKLSHNFFLTWILMMNRPAMQSSNVSILSSCIYLLLPWIVPVCAQLKNKLINSLTQIQFLTSSGLPPRTDDTDHLEYSLVTAIELVGTWSHRHSERQIVARVASSRSLPWPANVKVLNMSLNIYI